MFSPAFCFIIIILFIAPSALTMHQCIDNFIGRSMRTEKGFCRKGEHILLVHRSSSVFLLLLDLLWHRLFVAPRQAISAISRQVDRCWNRLEFPFSVVRHYKTIKDQTVPSHRKDPKQALRVLSCCQNCQLPRESIVSSSPFEILSPESLRRVGPGGIHGNVVLVYLTTFRL